MSIAQSNSLRSEDIEELSYALRSWQAGWQKTPESSLEPLSPFGPMAFNSTALLRLAWIRLHWDLGPSRNLESRDPALMAMAFKSSPPVRRDSQLSHAILHAAHALSIPVRIGISFVARTHTVTWSQQHSLCNLECAVFLSKWLESIANTAVQQPLIPKERSLVSMIRSMLKETDFAVPTSRDTTGKDIRHLGIAVVRAWAETFKGGHAFQIVGIIGASLEMYADLLESSGEPSTAYS